MLVDGKWTAEWHPVQAKDEKGGFVRQTSSFRNWITPDGSAGPTGEGGFAAEARRYHLYVALICPWASRTLIGRKLKKLDDVISVSVVEPALTDQGWRFATTRGPTTRRQWRHLPSRDHTRGPGLHRRATVPFCGTSVGNYREQEFGDILNVELGFGRPTRRSTSIRPTCATRSTP
jgi:putative glutathione S-transferase